MAVSHIRFYIAAFHGESALLATTLERLAKDMAAGELDACVVGSDDPALRLCAQQAGIPFHADLPGRVDEERFWTTLFSALGPQEGYTLVLRAGCLPPPFWINRLWSIAHHNNASAVFPLSVRNPANGAFTSTGHDPHLAVEEMDRWLTHYGSGMEFDLPVFAGYCGFFSNGWPQLQGGTDDALFAAQWIRQGALLITSDTLYVDDSALPEQSLAKGEFLAWKEALLTRHPLTDVREVLTELSLRQEEPPREVAPVRPVRLHIGHGRGGGLGRWLEDFIEADDQHQSLVLQPISSGSAMCDTLALYASARMEVPLRTWSLTRPILSTALRHHEYNSILQEICESFSVHDVMVSSLIGHSLDVLATGLDTTFICHDFYPVCPLLYATWENPCADCDTTRLGNCLRHNPHPQLFRAEPFEHWCALRDGFVRRVVEQDVTLVAACQSVVQRLQSLVPALAQTHISVIEHGLSPALAASLALARHRKQGGERLRIVVLGSLAEHKGAAILAPVLKSIATFADLVLLGSGEDGRRFRGIKGVSVVDFYEREDLGALLAEHEPDIGLLLSRVPETFSYTLSELRAAGIPVAATQLGAFADRTIHNGNGWLFAPDSASLLSLLQELHADRQRVVAVREALLGSPVRLSSEMVADYGSLDKLGASPFTLLAPSHPDIQFRSDEYVTQGHLHINHQAPFRQVLKDFIRYTENKVQGTERLPGMIKKIVGFCLRRLT